MKRIEGKYGDTISVASQRAIDHAIRTDAQVELEFNEVVMVVSRTMSAEDVVREYHRMFEERAAAYRATPEYKKRQLEQEERARVHAQEYQELVARAPAKMSIRAGKEDEYAAYQKRNSEDGYSARCVSYGEDWARFMEAELATGKKLSAVWKDCSHKADQDGITGFMYGCATQALNAFWVHGDELRRLHNADYGVTEEKAKGGTVNPAVLTVG